MEEDAKPRKQGIQHGGVDSCWHVLALAFVAQGLLSFGDRNSGFLYVGYMELFLVGRKQAIWPQTVAFVVGCPAGESLNERFLKLLSSDTITSCVFAERDRSQPQQHSIAARTRSFRTPGEGIRPNGNMLSRL